MVIGPDGKVPLPWLASDLRQAISSVRGHALLAHMSAGHGPLEFALCFAQSLLCESPPAHDAQLACGRCASCHLVQAQLHPDLFVLLPEVDRQRLGWRLPGDRADTGESDGEGKARKKPSRQLRVDEVRLAVEWVSTSSSRGRAKVLVIHPSERLNIIAANALLKTLEEPPAGVRMILTASDPAHLLPTVRSRCQRVQVKAPLPSQCLAWLLTQGVKDLQEAETLLRAAGGQPLSAAAMHRAGVSAQVWTALPRTMMNGSVGAFAGWAVPAVVDALQRICHDAMCIAIGAEPRYFPPHGFSRVGSLPALQRWGAELSRIARHDEHPWAEALLLESLVAQACTALNAGANRVPAGALAFDTLRP